MLMEEVREDNPKVHLLLIQYVLSCDLLRHKKCKNQMAACARVLLAKCPKPILNHVIPEIVKQYHAREEKNRKAFLKNASRLLHHLVLADYQKEFFPELYSPSTESFSETSFWGHWKYVIGEKALKVLYQAMQEAVSQNLKEEQQANRSRFIFKVRAVTECDVEAFLGKRLAFPCKEGSIVKRATRVSSDLRCRGFSDLLALKPSDFHHGNWQKREREGSALRRMIQHFNMLSQRVVEDILTASSVLHQEQIANFWSEVLLQGLHRKDYQTAMAIYSAFENASVCRLKYLLDGKKMKKAWGKARTLFCLDNNFSRYRSVLKKSGRRISVPHISPLLSDLVFSEEVEDLLKKESRSQEDLIEQLLLLGEKLLEFEKRRRKALRVRMLPPQTTIIQYISKSTFNALRQEESDALAHNLSYRFFSDKPFVIQREAVTHFGALQEVLFPRANQESEERKRLPRYLEICWVERQVSSATSFEDYYKVEKHREAYKSLVQFLVVLANQACLDDWLAPQTQEMIQAIRSEIEANFIMHGAYKKGFQQLNHIVSRRAPVKIELQDMAHIGNSDYSIPNKKQEFSEKANQVCAWAANRLRESVHSEDYIPRPFRRFLPIEGENILFQEEVAENRPAELLFQYEQQFVRNRWRSERTSRRSGGFCNGRFRRRGSLYCSTYDV